MTPKLLKNQKEYKAALRHLDLLMAVELPTAAQGDEMELFAHLIGQYEDQRFPIGSPTPVEAIRFRMEQAGLRQVDLVPYIGCKSKVSEVLSGHRPLSKRMIHRLHESLGIPMDILVQGSSAAKSRVKSGNAKTMSL